MDVPESTVAGGATIAVTPTFVTRTVTEPGSVSLVWYWSFVSAVEQRVASWPRGAAIQLAKLTRTESPAARLVTFWVLV